MAITTYNVGAAAVQILTANGNRQSVVIINQGTATVYLGDDNTVTATGTNAITLGGGGTQYQASGGPATLAKWAIATAGTQRIEVEAV